MKKHGLKHEDYMLLEGGIHMKRQCAACIAVMLLLGMLSAPALAKERYVWAFQGDVAFFEEDGKVGLLDQAENILLPPTYDAGGVFDQNGLAKVYMNDLIGCINKRGELIIPLTQCDYMGYLTYSRGGDPHLLDEVIRYSPESKAAQYSKATQCGFYTLDGRKIGEKLWDDAMSFVQGTSFVKENNQWNLLDLEGNLLSNIWWDTVEKVNCYEGGGTVRKGDRQYEVDARGKVLREESLDEKRHARLIALYDKNGAKVDISPWEDMLPFYGDIRMVLKDGLWGLIDGEGAILQQPYWDNIRITTEGQILHPREMAQVTKDGMRGWIDQYGNVALQPEWSGTVQIANNRFHAPIGEWEEVTHYILDEKGTVINEVPKQYVVERYFKEYMFYTMSGSKKSWTWGFIDPNGEVLCSLPFRDYVYDLSYDELVDGMMHIMYKGKPGYVDVYGNLLIAKGWQYCDDFHEGLAFVYTDTGCIIIDKEGNPVCSPRKWDGNSGFHYIADQLVAIVRIQDENGELVSGYVNERGEYLCGLK
ncbi:hypothetical protein FACS1894196_4260 [Clostridia bacterium]|nr:hypothetical protein FACS1894196_4260 [Clostridia bacterium]